MTDSDRDTRMRMAAFEHIRGLHEVHDHLTTDELKPGFVFDGKRIPLINPQRGIFKPQQMRFVLSIKTVFPRPGRKIWYDDQREVHRQIFEGDETVDYAFMGQDPEAADNRWLREAFENQVPVIYFLGIAPGCYKAMLPAFISGWDATALKARVAFGGLDKEALTPPENALERRYALSAVKQRLHQASFREAIIRAYNGRCALSRIPEPLLLDAAHIVSDTDERFGQPVIPNGIPLSKIHHAAFDAHLIGIDPDYRLHVSNRLLEQNDGPMLDALKRLNGGTIHLPSRIKDRPDRDRLAIRFLLIRDTPLGKAYVLGTFLTREVTDMGFKVASRVRGLSDEAFREAFGAEEQCRSALSRLRWPDGFVCPACGHRGHCVLAGRSLYQCYRCKKQTSSTAGTIFHATKLPLTLWFAAVHLIVTAKNGITSVELGRRLGVKQPTAWTMKHKIMAVMARREADTPLSGRVEMDDAYLGGARAGGKRGRGAPGKTPFVAAVSTSPEGRPRKVKLVPLKGFRKREIARGAKRWLAPGSEVLTDGLRCWNALDGVVGSHRAIRTGSGRQAARMAPFKWVNTTLGNIKSAITGTYRKLGPDHAQRYLASFAWRYNRRYQLNTMIPRFVHSAARTQPIPYRALIAG